MTWDKVTGDFDFLNGYFDVRHRTLKQALAGCAEWLEYDGTTTARTYFDGQISIDEMRFPTKGSYGLSLRLFDPIAQEWSIWWVDSRTMQLYPPVRGGWAADGSSCRLVGEDTLDGKPILCSYEWSDITDETAHWEQAFSPDGGLTWETNWIMDFTRRATPPPSLELPKLTDDFDFLVGRWAFHNRRRRPVLGEPFTWYEHEATMEATTYFDGAISFDEGWFPSEGFRGATFRLYDPVAETWSIHWINSTRGQLETPVIGAFSEGTGVFEGPDTWEGQPIDVRFLWTPGTDKAAWEQSFSTDAGQTWTTNWYMEHTRLK
ncbi:hypothetical protein GCM10009630_43380 [Kribbella jejuensis]|uniref:DUF1579 domain-containing protein n=1 Tax=Kribbella jejuensis TaxID=236068 RepID=A0A542ENS8_9ACTN|nr:hypothetical protein [Kribbella jejuensis]TQJ16979.1 hypothetical protein FB475_1089 [Kribbella jejuensis]